MDKNTRKRYTRRGALGLMGVGAVGVGLETVGFTNISSERQSQITVANDNDAGVAVQITADGDLRDGGSTDGGPLLTDDPFATELTVTFTNNTSTNLSDTEFTVSITNNGSYDVSVSGFNTGTVSSGGGTGSFSTGSGLDADQSVDLIIENTAPPAATSGDNSVDIDITTEADFGTTLSIDRTNITVEEIQGSVIIDTIRTSSDEVDVIVNSFTNDRGDVRVVNQATSNDEINNNTTFSDGETLTFTSLGAISENDTIKAELRDDDAAIIDSDTSDAPAP